MICALCWVLLENVELAVSEHIRTLGGSDSYSSKKISCNLSKSLCRKNSYSSLFARFQYLGKLKLLIIDGCRDTCEELQDLHKNSSFAKLVCFVYESIRRSRKLLILPQLMANPLNVDRAGYTVHIPRISSGPVSVLSGRLCRTKNVELIILTLSWSIWA